MINQLVTEKLGLNQPCEVQTSKAFENHCHSLTNLSPRKSKPKCSKKGNWKMETTKVKLVIDRMYIHNLILLCIVTLTLLMGCLNCSKSTKPAQNHQQFKRAPTTTNVTTKNPSKSIFNQEIFLSQGVSSLLKEGYHSTNQSVASAINRLTSRHPEISRSFIIGASTDKNPIYAIEISSHSKETLKLTKPSIAILGGIHGDHALGHELVLYLAAFLLDNYENNNENRVRMLIDTIDIFLIPTLNPDGFYKATEGDCYSAKRITGHDNSAGVDLDQDFKFHTYNDISSVLANNKLQPESKALVDWLVLGGRNLQLFLTLRTGYTGVTYPTTETSSSLTDYLSKTTSSEPKSSLDEELFKYLAEHVFYQFQREPKDSECTLLSNNQTVIPERLMGFTSGTLNSFLYKFTDILPMSIYLDCCKYPNHKTLEYKWLQHSNSLIALLESTLFSVNGKVFDRASHKPISRARVSISGVTRSFITDELGNFQLLITPGREYQILVEADGYSSSEKLNISASSVNLITGSVKVKVLNISLDRQAQTSGISSVTNSVNSSITLDELPPTSILKPQVLFDNVDEDIDRLEFLTSTDIDKHHTYEELVATLVSLNQKYPKISRLYDIGSSYQNRKLWVFEISNEPGAHQILKPEFRYIANIHGNEVVGREALLHLAKLLLENYGRSNLVTALVNSTRIHLLPSMNPDGYEQSRVGDCESEVGRPNSHGIDLNRNFPDRIMENSENKERQVEVEAIMNWSKEIPFVLGANLHGGSLVANYPYDGNKEDKSGLYTKSPDDSLFKHLAKVYSTNHPTMSKGEHCYDICGDNDRSTLLNERFPDGITNGAHWYVLYGGIQDWVYLNTNCMSVTLELGCRKYPEAKELPRYWNDNKKPLIKYMLEVHRGIYGVVTDPLARPVFNATIHVKGIDHDIHSTENGDYWRLLLPGEYFVSVTKEGFRTAHRTVTVGTYGSPAQRVDFSLSSGPKDLSLDVVPAFNEPITLPPSRTTLSGVGDHQEDFMSISESSLETHRPQQSSTLIPRGRLSDGSSTLNASTRPFPEHQDTRYLMALCFIIVLPSIALLIYMFGSTDAKRNPSKLGFSRLSTGVVDDMDGDDDDEATKFMKRSNFGSKFMSLGDAQGSESEDELYSVETWTK